MPKQSLESSISCNLGRIAFNLFTEDDEFKSAKDFQEICDLLKKRSDGEITTTPPTVKKMITSWVAANKCKVSDFQELFKSEKPKRRGKVSFREQLEVHYKKTIWEVFEEKLKSCKNMKQAINTLKRDSDNEVTTSEQTLKKTIELGLKNEEFDESSFWVQWVPKKRKRKVKDDDDGRIRSKSKKIVTTAECKKCSWKGKRMFGIFDNDFVLGLGARRCPKCKSWGSLIVSFAHDNKNVCITTTMDKAGSIWENFVNENLEIISNPFKKDKLTKDVKNRKVEWE